MLALHIMLLTSSATNMAPSAITATPTGLTYTSLLDGSAINPVKKSSDLPFGLPLSNGQIQLYSPIIASGSRSHADHKSSATVPDRESLFIIKRKP